MSTTETLQNYHHPGNQESTHANKRDVFYSATRNYISVGLHDDIILSSDGKGKNRTSVDDVVTLIITDMNDSRNCATYTHDYSNGCGGRITPIDPVNLMAEIPDFKNLRGKTVSALIEFSDKCGGSEWASNFYLCFKDTSVISNDIL